MLAVKQFISNWEYCHGRIKIWKGNKLFPNFYQVRLYQEEEEKTKYLHTKPTK